MSSQLLFLISKSISTLFANAFNSNVCKHVNSNQISISAFTIFLLRALHVPKRTLFASKFRFSHLYFHHMHKKASTSYWHKAWLNLMVFDGSEKSEQKTKLIKMYSSENEFYDANNLYHLFDRFHFHSLFFNGEDKCLHKLQHWMYQYQHCIALPQYWK